MTEPTIDPSAQARISKRAVRRRQATATLCMASLMLQQACYTSTPVAGMANTITGPVTLTVNERGRVLVGSKLGTLLDHVDGRIVRSDSVSVEVAVETAEDVRGSMARWGGERVTFPREGIQSMTAKKLARGRTALLVGGVLVGIIGGILGIKGRKNSSDGKPGGGDPDPI